MPRSDLISLIGLRRAMRRQSALKKESVSNELGDSRWIALLARQVNTTPYSPGPVYEFVCISFRTDNLNCFRAS